MVQTVQMACHGCGLNSLFGLVSSAFAAKEESAGSHIAAGKFQKVSRRPLPWSTSNFEWMVRGETKEKRADREQWKSCNFVSLGHGAVQAISWYLYRKCDCRSKASNTVGLLKPINQKIQSLLGLTAFQAVPQRFTGRWNCLTDRLRRSVLLTQEYKLLKTL